MANATAGEPRPETPGVVRIYHERLRAFVDRAGVRGGVPGDQLEAFTTSFVEADLRGVTSHGVARIPAYVRAFLRGIVNPAPELRTIRRSGATALIDADNGLGMVVGQFAMDLAISLADAAGVGVVSVRNSNHSGMLAVHVMRATAAGKVGFFTSNGAAIMAPWGGAEAKLSNGPFAWAVPRAAGLPPLVADMAASATARGKIRQIAAAGGTVPVGWALGPDDRETTDARQAMLGVVLPMAGHKGSGIAIINEVLAAGLAGAALAVDTPRDFLKEGATVLDSWRIGHLALAIDPAAFAGVEEFEARVERLVEEIKGSRKAADAEEVLLPGEPEWRRRDRSLRDGVEIAANTASALDAFAAEIGIEGLTR